MAAEIKVGGAPGQLEIRPAGACSIRVTLKPVSFQLEFPYSPAVAFAWTSLTWDDAARRLVIERDPAAGTLELPPRKLLVQLVNEGKTKEIVYDGRRTEVGF